MLHILPRRLGTVVGALICSIFLVGCQNIGGGDVDPRLTSGEDAKFFSKSGLQACAADRHGLRRPHATDHPPRCDGI